MGVQALPLSRALTTSSAATAFTAQIPKATEPSGAGVFDLLSKSLGWGGGVVVPSYVQLIPFGTDANDETFDFRLWGWSKVGVSSLYIPQLLIDVSVILGNISGTAIAASTFMADTLTVNDGPIDNGPWRSFIDAQEDLSASVLVHTRGCRYVSFDFDMITAASGNCFIRPLSE